MSASLAALQAAFKRNWSVAVDPFTGHGRRQLRQSIAVAFGAVVLVLLLASANIANLLLAKAWHGGRRWRFAPRSVPAGAGWSLRCSPSAWCSA